GTCCGRSDEVDVRPRMLQFPEVAVDLVHPTVLAALRDVELLLDVRLTLAPELPRPDLLERLAQDVAVEEALVEEIGAAAVEVAVGHDVRPEVWRRHALGVVPVAVRELLHGVPAEDHLEPIAVDLLELLRQIEVWPVIDALVAMGDAHEVLRVRLDHQIVEPRALATLGELDGVRHILGEEQHLRAERAAGAKRGP